MSHPYESLINTETANGRERASVQVGNVAWYAKPRAARRRARAERRAILRRTLRPPSTCEPIWRRGPSRERCRRPYERHRRPYERAGRSEADGMERSDLFDVVHAAIEQLAVDAPVLMIIEDVDWADQSTRELLSFLFARRFSRPIALVVSYRSDDLHREHPLRAPAAEWSRLANVRRVTLPVLSDADVRTLARALDPAPCRSTSCTRSSRAPKATRSSPESWSRRHSWGSAAFPTAWPTFSCCA